MIAAPSRLQRLTGFGMAVATDAYVHRPTSIDELRALVRSARAEGRRVSLRGTGLSYGDASLGAETISIGFERMRRVLGWDRERGVIDCEPGVTIGDLWRYTLEDGFWPPVVSGTMHPTLGGALGMNIHGKNAYRVGPIGDHVLEFDLMDGAGEVRTIRPEDPEFRVVIGGAGLFGIVTRVQLELKRVTSGELRVLALSCNDWGEQLAAFRRYEPDADYMVTWIDAFAHGKGAGRGLFHAAWYADEGPGYHASLSPAHQDLPDTVMGLVPKSVVWRPLKALNRRLGMKFVNAAKQRAGATLGNGQIHHQSLVAFSFLLDYVPNWRWAYLPGGFIQYQSFVPKEHAPEVFAKQCEMQRAAKLESYLAVMKRHKPDRYLLSHAVDGYSLALDFKVTQRNRERLWALCHQMNDLVLQSGGRFYLAKDLTLRPSDVEAYLGQEALAELREWKRRLDPDGLFGTVLAERLQLFAP